MNTSVIIPTYKGEHKIANILNALSNQTISDFEVIVVIDGVFDNTKSKIIPFLNNLKIKIIETQNNGRGKARNIGVENSNSDLLIFFDDDMIPEPEAIQLHMEHHQKYENSFVFGMARMHIEGDLKNDFYKYRYAIESEWQKEIEKGFCEINYSNYSFSSCNMSVKKDTFTSLKGFDSSMNDSEDYDLSMRALKNNIKVFCNPKIWAWHADYATIEQYINRQKEYNKARQTLAVSKPEYLTLHPLGFNVISEYKGIKKILMGFFNFNFIWKFILKSVIFKSMSKKIRFKVYSLIIFSSSNLE
jgi:glycosyltransferase involved in cell wall biosynthesis